MSLIHSTWLSTSSQLMAAILTPRFVNSATYLKRGSAPAARAPWRSCARGGAGLSHLATVPSSVVQTGVKSAGCEKRMPHESPQ